MKKVILVCLICISLISYYLFSPHPLAHAPVEFTLEQGSLKHAAAKMQEAGVIGDALPFVMLARLMGKASKIKAGNYELIHPESPLALLERITEGDYTQSKFTLVEGTSFSELRKELDANPDLKHDSENLSDAQIDEALAIQAPSPEGLFFPDTYYFAKGQSDFSILRRALASMKRRLDSAWQRRESGLPFKNPYEALTLASIVEKETGKDADRAMISAVFINRLKLGMKLQTDPAVIYGLGERFDGNLRKHDLLTDQPYNTYTRAGLPPTPISMPGMKSINAVLHPAQTHALYFVARGDGSSIFSNSLAEHNRAVDRYQKK